ncbi:hypothetical protein [Sphingomonas sp.]
MRPTDIVIVIICALLGYGIVRNLLGRSPVNQGEAPAEQPAARDDD